MKKKKGIYIYIKIYKYIYTFIIKEKKNKLTISN